MLGPDDRDLIIHASDTLKSLNNNAEDFAGVPNSVMERNWMRTFPGEEGPSRRS